VSVAACVSLRFSGFLSSDRVLDNGTGSDVFGIAVDNRLVWAFDRNGEVNGYQRNCTGAVCAPACRTPTFAPSMFTEVTVPPTVANRVLYISREADQVHDVVAADDTRGSAGGATLPASVVRDGARSAMNTRSSVALEVNPRCRRRSSWDRSRIAHLRCLRACGGVGRLREGVARRPWMAVGIARTKPAQGRESPPASAKARNSRRFARLAHVTPDRHDRSALLPHCRPSADGEHRAPICIATTPGRMAVEGETGRHDVRSGRSLCHRRTLPVPTIHRQYQRGRVLSLTPRTRLASGHSEVIAYVSGVS
jgi:hypothetical protein